MALTPRLELRQGQSLVMTPQLQQAIKLLQLSNLELSAYVEQELERNPFLDRTEGEASSATDGGGAEERGGSEPAEDFTAHEQPPSGDAGLDVDYDNLWNNDSIADGAPAGLAESAFAAWGARGGRGFDGVAADLEQTVSGEETLREHLMGQINMELVDPVDRLIGLQLIELLDEAGYIGGDLDTVAARLGCASARVETVLERLQHCDPPGIFARSLAECLALQLRERNRLDPAMKALLDNLNLLAKRDTVGLKRVCGVDEDDLADMVAEIRALDPKPALAFDRPLVQTVVPDVLMRAQPGGRWMIELNSETLPRVLVNNRYFASISRDSLTKDERHYLDSCMAAASWLVKSLHQRATTILKVATEIVRQQDGFFRHGVSALKPLVLRDIAQAIEMHESTVSRVTSNKYLATPRGIFELKYFFTPAIARAGGGEALSAEAVRHRIKALIDAETAGAVLSDDKLVELLTAEGMDIARRTVAKYREAMGIPSSVQRRREKASGF